MSQTETSKSDFGAQTTEDVELTDEDSTRVMKFMNKVLPLLELELDANSTSTAFDGYTALREDIAEALQLWNILTVDLEKHKVCSVLQQTTSITVYNITYYDISSDISLSPLL